MSTTRYKDPIPKGVCVFTTLDEAAQNQKANPYAIFYPENSENYAKDPDGTVVAIASDEIGRWDFGNPSDRDYATAYGAVGCNRTWCDEVKVVYVSLDKINISLILLEYQEESKRKTKSCPSYAATTHFDIPLQGATVLDTENDLREFTASRSDVNLETPNGGYTINKPNGRILAHVGDDLGKEMTEKMRRLNLLEQLLAEKGVSENDISKIFETARGCSNPICVYSDVPG